MDLNAVAMGAKNPGFGPRSSSWYEIKTETMASDASGANHVQSKDS